MANNTGYNDYTTNERHFASNRPERRYASSEVCPLHRATALIQLNGACRLRHKAFDSPLRWLYVAFVVPARPATLWEVRVAIPTANPQGSGQATVHGGEPTTSTSRRRGTNPHEVTQYKLLKQKETPRIDRQSYPLHEGLRLLVVAGRFGFV